MAHYAFITKPDHHGVSIVTEVIAGNDEGQGTDWEVYYAGVRGALCKRTSYHTQGGVHRNGGVPFRLNYAGIGMEYHAGIDGFVPPCPGDGWTLDEVTGTWVEAE